MESQPTQVVRRLAGGVLVEFAATQLRDVRPDVAMSKAGRIHGEEREGLHQREHATIPETEAGRALGADDDRLGNGVEVIVPDQAVVAQIFDAQEAPVSGKADLPQGGQIVERTTDLEVIRVVDGGFSPEGLSFFVVLLDL